MSGVGDSSRRGTRKKEREREAPEAEAERSTERDWTKWVREPVCGERRAERVAMRAEGARMPGLAGPEGVGGGETGMKDMVGWLVAAGQKVVVVVLRSLIEKMVRLSRACDCEILGPFECR